MDLEKQIEEMFLDDAKVSEFTKSIGDSISRNEYKLVKVVEVLGPRLTSKDTMERAKGMAIFSFVLNNIDEGVLNEEELSFVVEFLFDRLKDQHMVLPKVIHSIKSIISNPNLPKGAAAKLMMQLFKEANIQSHIHKDRHAFFLTMAYVVQEKSEEIKDWGSDFIMFFVQAMDGEKDPRNLLLLFRLVPTILANFPMGPLVEDVFEVLSCYFPVDFQPTKTVDNEIPITREDLAKYLHSCLSFTRKFSQFVLPLVIEKLESNVVSAKLDSTELLKLCCETSYTAADLEPHLPALWRICRNEIFMGGNEAVTEALYQVIQSIFRVLSSSPESMEKYMKTIFTECKHHLMEPEMRLMQPASSILQSIIEASEGSAKLLLSWLLPLIYEQFLSKAALSEKLSLLMLMNRVILTSKRAWTFKILEITPNGDEIVATIFGLLTHINTGLKDLGLEFFALVTPELDGASVDVLHSHLLSLMETETSFPPLSTQKSLFECLEKLAISHPARSFEATLRKLIAIAEDTSSTTEKKDFILTAISECAYFGEGKEIVVPYLLTQIQKRTVETEELIMKDETSVLQNNDTAAVSSLASLLKSLLQVTQKGCSKESNYVVHLSKQSVQSVSSNSVLEFCDRVLGMKCVDVLAVSAGSSRKLNMIAKDDDVVIRNLTEQTYSTATEIIRILLRNSRVEAQQDCIDYLWTQKISASSVSDVIGSTPELLLASVIGPLQRSVKIPSFPELMDELFSKASRVLSTPQNDSLGDLTVTDHDAGVKLYATLLNKCSQDEFARQETKLNALLQTFRYPDMDMSSGDSSKLESTFRSCHLVILAFKAIAIRGAPEFENWLDKILDLLRSDPVGSYIADHFEVLLEDCPLLLNMQSHCNYRFLYKQRLFLSSVPKLVKAYKASPPDDVCRVNYIRALSCQLRHVPNSVLKMELTNVLPLLVASLNCEASSVPIRISSLNALHSLIADQCEKVEDASDNFILKEYYHDIVPHLLKLATFKESMEVRLLALQCLQKCARFPQLMIIQQKNQVIDALRPVLDDAKRIVRQEAVAARNIWFLAGAPGGL